MAMRAAASGRRQYYGVAGGVRPSHRRAQRGGVRMGTQQGCSWQGLCRTRRAGPARCR